jgi:hypothetical protein
MHCPSIYIEELRKQNTKVLTDIDLSTSGSVAEEAGNYRGISFLSCLFN